MRQTVTQLLVHRRERMRHELRQSELAAPEAGDVIVRIERFGLSANNVTYAALGDALHYFSFFAVDEEWSALPVWGVASVVESRSELLPVGARLFGFFPAASHATLRIAASTPTGVRADRPQIPREFALYNQYTVADRDPAYLADREGFMVVLRPLFMTGLVLADYLVAKQRLGAELVVISSAASKTAYGVAAALRLRGESDVVGIASTPMVAAAAALDAYSLVRSYDQLTFLASKRSVVYVDVAGSREVRDRLAAHLGAGLRAIISVGLTHWRDGTFGTSSDPGVVPTETFFAPGWMAERSRELGASFFGRIGTDWRALMALAESKFTLREQRGGEALASSFAALVSGNASAADAEVHAL